jgi:tRNA (guanine-N7-)-methyltransferase
MTADNQLQKPHRPIRSFVLRQGRLTEGQQFALDNYWQLYGLEPNTPLNTEQVFNKAAPIVLEIGFGNGESLAAMAKENPQFNYIGIEVHKPGVGHLLGLIHNQQLTNVRVYCHDAIEVLQHCIANHSLNRLQLFFPDPWHKKKHHKRRIVNNNFLDLLHTKLTQDGVFHVATDWEHYAEWILALLSTNTHWHNQSETNDYCPRPDYRPLTKFEQRGIRLGHGVWDLLFQIR